MEKEEMIPADEFCTYNNVEYSFIDSLQDSGLIEMTIVEERGYIPANQVLEVERFARLHYDLDINIEGIEAIAHLLNRLKDMQGEVASLRNKLKRFDV
jgi:hypothetical protein